MKARLLIGVAALAGAFCIPESAFAFVCGDYVMQGNTVKRSLLRGAITQPAALVEIRRISGEARASQGCDPTNLNALLNIVTYIERYEGAPPPPPPPPSPGTDIVSPPPPPPQDSRPTVIAIGQPVVGELSDRSAVDPETGVPYEMYRFHAEAAAPLQISMSEVGGSGLDTYVVVGRMRNGQFEELAYNDDSRGTLNSQLSFDPPESGEYAVRARSFWQGDYGAYELLVELMPEIIPPTIRPLALDQVVAAELSANSSTAPDRGTAQDIWTFQAESGARLAISMSASEDSSLDTYLVLGQMYEGEFYPISYNDDRGDGTFNSLLRFRPTESGEYAIRATSYAQGQYGGYDLIVEREAFLFDNPTRLDASENAWMQAGALSAEVGHVDFEFRPTRAGRYRVQVMSEEFVPTVEIGAVGRDNSLTEINDPAAAAGYVVEFDGQRRGRYIVRVASSAASFGAFSVLISPAPAPEAEPEPEPEPEN